MSMNYRTVEKKFKVAELAAKLPELSQEQKIKRNKFFESQPKDFRAEVEEIVSNYIDQKEWGKLVKVAFDRAIRYYQRDRLQARDLVRFQSIDSEFYQWVVGSGFTAAFNAPGAAKRVVTFDLSSRFARVYKAGLAVEFTDEVREQLTLDLMNETISKVVDAFDELETDVILKGLSAAVADGTTYAGHQFPSHVLNGASGPYTSSKFTHDKMLDMMYVLEREGYRATTMTMGLDIYYDLLNLEPFKDAAQKWTSATSPRATALIEGGSPGAPLLPGLSLVSLVISPLIPSGEVLMYDRQEYFDFAEREGLSSETAPHDGLHDVSMTTYRTRYGVAAREPMAGVKMTNIAGIDLTNKFA